MKLFIGIEGIAMRFSVGVMSDETGEIISSVRLNGYSLSLHTMPRNVLRVRLLRLLKVLLKRAGLDLCDLKNCTICIGLTGTTFGYDREVDLHKEFNELNIDIEKLICTGDVEIAFASHTHNSEGSAIICHCGSTAYVVNRSDKKLNHVRFGGWGPAFGDEGSAFYMGKEVLRIIALEHDMRKEDYSILWKEVNNWLNNPEPSLNAWTRGSLYWKEINKEFNKWSERSPRKHDPRTLIFFFSHILHSFNEPAFKFEGLELWRRVSSGLVVPLMRAYRRGDPAAKQIVSNAIESLADQHQKAFEIAKKLYRAKNIEPLVLYGGVINHNKNFLNKLIHVLNDKYDRNISPITIDTPNTLRPVCGALLFALGGSETGNLRLPPKKIIDNLLKSQRERPFMRDLKND
ncbi:MAG: BadF/BadG/BcrA/BcrD ATPase family protein [Candidatus Hodarchaeota archaeon]